MKNLYNALYISGALMFLISVLGGSITKPLFSTMSENALETAGLKKSYVFAADDKIDDTFYMIRKIEYQVERIKNIFSSEKIDESRFKREQNNLIENNLYSPLVLTLNYVFRLGLFLTGVIMALTGVIVHLVHRSLDLRSRVARLEAVILAGNRA
jgi:hypothetical protein